MRKICISIFSVYGILLMACSKDSQSFEPTPLNLSYPSWVEQYVGKPHLPADNPLTVEGFELGRRLFYDTRLSADGSMSCASCHQQQYSFDDNRAFSIGVDGTVGKRNAMPLINLAWSKSFFWDGRRPSLELQAHDPVVSPSELKNTWPQVVARLQADPEIVERFFRAFGSRSIDSTLIVKAIAQFERTLISFNSRYDRYVYQNDTLALTEQERRGYQIFLNEGLCNHCHTEPLFTDQAFRNNGLDAVPADAGRGGVTGNPADFGTFKVPTLRNIALTAPYMHDGRFQTLEEVVQHYSDGIVPHSPNLDVHLQGVGTGVALTAQQQADLVAFLRALTDSTFISNTAFQNPY
ncbi:MAG: cytochrome-c peroxidase [Chitinophagales bacterium]|nr:cytochrome-c peroxidase [Chitinophagales bacterium]MDW8428682.1 cytochrome c peroxidase [Chitinophagales bacterium]